MIKIFSIMCVLCFLSVSAYAETPGQDLKIIEEFKNAADAQPAKVTQSPIGAAAFDDPVRYTLGADDIIEITVMRHPEFSGMYPINMEGKIQYKFVGDIEVTGLTKKGLEDKIKGIIASYVIDPEVNITILEYRSKVIYVLGEVGNPGKFYMRSDSIPVREAVVAAGLPTMAAAMRKCKIITPDKNGKAKTKKVDIYALLYGGNLKNNLEMKSGEVLYVPSTVMAKIIRVISPVTTTVATAASGPQDIQSGKAATNALSR